jgi:mannose-6-phosphate isomerase-like protein (cupin superfamily)
VKTPGRQALRITGTIIPNQPAMSPSPLTVVDIQQEIQGVTGYHNIPVALANDHVVRLSVMTEAYHWHHHPNSDEVFLGVEGVVCIELEDRTVELAPGQLFTVPANVRHRTRPQGPRSVNLTFELVGMETVAG